MSTDNLIIGIVNHRYANIHSVKKALNFINCKHIELNKPSDFSKVDAIILPGVGAFDAAMQVLNRSGMTESLKNANHKQTPIFGICLGMQLLFEKSEEGSEKGLGLIEGNVKKIIQIDDIKIPHMGWNKTYYQNKNNIFKNIKNESFFYYVHSYECIPSNKSVISSYANYGNKICSSVENENIIATQFHPEKSGNNGIKLYKNFIERLAK